LPKLSNFDQGAIGQAIEAAGAGQFGRLHKEALDDSLSLFNSTGCEHQAKRATVR
jgi:hypothetical protein